MCCHHSNMFLAGTYMKMSSLHTTLSTIAAIPQKKNKLLLCVSPTTWQQKVILLYPYDQLQVYIIIKGQWKYMMAVEYDEFRLYEDMNNPLGPPCNIHTFHIVLTTARLALQSILVLWISSNMRPNGVINSKHFSSESKANSCTTKLRGNNGR